MAIKAIAMDIDGTLTNDQKVISPRTREKLLAAQESGIKLILASGRPAWGLHALAQELDLQNHDGLLVAFNGAHVSMPRPMRCCSTRRCRSMNCIA